MVKDCVAGQSSIRLVYEYKTVIKLDTHLRSRTVVDEEQDDVATAGACRRVLHKLPTLIDCADCSQQY